MRIALYIILVTNTLAAMVMLGTAKTVHHEIMAATTFLVAVVALVGIALLAAIAEAQNRIGSELAALQTTFREKFSRHEKPPIKPFLFQEPRAGEQGSMHYAVESLATKGYFVERLESDGRLRYFAVVSARDKSTRYCYSEKELIDLYLEKVASETHAG